VKRLLFGNPKKGGQGPNWAVQPYDDNDDRPIQMCTHDYLYSGMYFYLVRFEVITVVRMTLLFFWLVTQYRLVVDIDVSEEHIVSIFHAEIR
jgi:hypothetical protein